VRERAREGENEKEREGGSERERFETEARKDGQSETACNALQHTVLLCNTHSHTLHAKITYYKHILLVREGMKEGKTRGGREGK